VARYIGLDAQKRYIRGYEFQPYRVEGKHGRHLRFPNTPAGWAHFIAHLDADVQIAVEVTRRAFELYDILAPHAAHVLVSNPVAMRRLGSGRHTDREYAVRLAQMLAWRTLPAVWVPPHPVRGVRRLLKVRERLGSYRRALTNQARAVLSRHGMLLPKGPYALRQVTPHAKQAILVRVLTAAQTLAEQ
jgi:transposase